MTHRRLLELARLPSSPRELRAAQVEIATLVALPLAEVTPWLARLPARVPRALDEPDLERVAAKLRGLGATVTLVDASSEAWACEHHPELLAELACASCSRPICAACAGADLSARCPACSKKKERSRAFFLARVSILLVILAGVVLYAWRDISGRRARTDWNRTLDVALVLVERQAVSRTATAAIEPRSRDLADLLASEMGRYRKGSAPPFRFHVFGPVSESSDPPKPSSPGVLGDTKYAYAIWRYTSRIDGQAALSKGQFDARIYLVVVPPESEERKMVEGASEQNGRVGIVDVELDDTMVDFALSVAAHELFHTLGATDKYDLGTLGIAVPGGLAEPELVPMYPQRYVELMARHRPIDETHSKPPKVLTDLRIGKETAREIGWSK